MTNARLALLLHISFLLVTVADAGERRNLVKVISPTPGQEMGAVVKLVVAAVINDKSEVWAFVRPEEVPHWWPQIEPIEVEPGIWETRVYLGSELDIGREFDIVVATFDKATSLRIREYHYKAMSSGNWLPITLPEANSNVAIIRVLRRTHD